MSLDYGGNVTLKCGLNYNIPNHLDNLVSRNYIKLTITFNFWGNWY